MHMKLLLVHGIWDTGAAFAPLQRFLAAHGHTALAPALVPSNGYLGIADLAGKLRDYVTAHFAPDERFAVVAFSMGCIVTRYYLQQLEGYKRVRAFFAISGPHAGTLTAYCYYGQAAKDMRPGSELLRSLDASCHCLADVHIVSYWTPFDMTIFPPNHSCWRHGATRMVLSPLHRLMAANQTVHADILEHLRALDRDGTDGDLPTAPPVQATK